MQSKATTAKQYLNELPQERIQVMTRLRNIILDNLPEGFEECISYGMLGYVVPLKKTTLAYTTLEYIVIHN